MQRDTTGSENRPLVGAYGGLLSVPVKDWTSEDHELNRLLLNEDETKLLESDVSIAHLCYLFLQGRTRWPKRIPLGGQSFELFRELAWAFLNGTHDQLDRETLVFNEVRRQINDFRKALREAPTTADQGGEK